MSDYLEVLKGSAVKSTLEDVDFLSLSFTNGSIIVANAGYEIIGPNRKIDIGMMVAAVHEFGKIIEVCFQNDVVLKISTLVKQEFGTEAVLLKVPGRPIVVWNNN